MSKKLLHGLLLALALVLTVVAVPGAAQAAPSGGGCQNVDAGGANVRPCISYRASGPALYLDGYVNRVGPNRCIVIRQWVIYNGSWIDLNRALQVTGDNQYIDPYRFNVSGASSQTARNVFRVYTCGGSHVRDALSPEQRW